MLTSVLLPLLLQGAGPAPETHSVAAARASLAAAERAYADSSAPGAATDAIVRMLADDAILVGGRVEMPRGQAARETLSRDTLLAGATYSWTPVRVDVSADGTHGYSFGFTDLTRASGERIPGKYSAYWRREPNGAWKVIALRRVRRPPGAVSADAPAGFGTPTATAYPSYAPRDAAALRDSVDAVERAFSAHSGEHGPAAAFAAFAAPDGAHFGRDPGMLWGPQAIGAQFADFPSTQSFSWGPDVVVVAPSGDLAFTTGPIAVHERKADGTTSSAPGGRYFSIWRRQPDGSWKFVIDG